MNRTITRKPQKKYLISILLILYVHLNCWIYNTIYDFGKLGVVLCCGLFLLSLATFVVFFRQNSAVLRLSAPMGSLIFFALYLCCRYALAGLFSSGLLLLGMVFLSLFFQNKEISAADEIIPKRLFLLLDVFFLSGVLFQLFFNDYYMSHIAVLFSSNSLASIIGWNGSGWYCGFTHQLGFTATFLAYGIGLLLYNNDLKKWCKWALLLLFYIGMVLTGKRTLFIIVVFVPLIVRYLSERSLAKKVIKIIAPFAGVLAAYYLIVAFSPFLLEIGGSITRLTESITGAGNALGVRAEIWKSAIEAFLQKPIWGIGIGNFSYHNFGGHNAYLTLLCETGLIGCALFVWMLISFLSKTVRLLHVASSELNSPLKLSLYFQLLFIINSLTENTMIATLSDFIIYALFATIPLLCCQSRNGTKKRDAV